MIYMIYCIYIYIYNIFQPDIEAMTYKRLSEALQGSGDLGPLTCLLGRPDLPDQGWGCAVGEPIGHCLREMDVPPEARRTSEHGKEDVLLGEPPIVGFFWSHMHVG